MHVLRDYCTITVRFSDGEEWVSPTYRSSVGFSAWIDPRRGDNVALIGGWIADRFQEQDGHHLDRAPAN